MERWVPGPALPVRGPELPTGSPASPSPDPLAVIRTSRRLSRHGGRGGAAALPRTIGPGVVEERLFVCCPGCALRVERREKGAGCSAGLMLGTHYARYCLGFEGRRRFERQHPRRAGLKAAPVETQRAFAQPLALSAPSSTACECSHRVGFRVSLRRLEASGVPCRLCPLGDSVGDVGRRGVRSMAPAIDPPPFVVDAVFHGKHWTADR